MQANRHHLTTIVVTIVTLVPYFIVIVQLVEPYFFYIVVFFTLAFCLFAIAYNLTVFRPHQCFRTLSWHRNCLTSTHLLLPVTIALSYCCVHNCLWLRMATNLANQSPNVFWIRNKVFTFWRELRFDRTSRFPKAITRLCNLFLLQEWIYIIGQFDKKKFVSSHHFPQRSSGIWKLVRPVVARFESSDCGNGWDAPTTDQFTTGVTISHLRAIPTYTIVSF